MSIILGVGGNLYVSYIAATQRPLSNLYGRPAKFLPLKIWRPPMMDAVMVLFGLLMFVAFLGYTTLCENL